MDAGPFTWVTAEEAYGQNRARHRWLADGQLMYVIATRCGDLLALPGGPRRPDRWERRSAGAGAPASA